MIVRPLIEGVGHMSDTELLLKSEPVRRLEVFTGAGRRRDWTVEQKARIIAESYAGGETVSSVARRHGLTPQQLFGWRRAALRCGEDGAGESGSAFVPVIVEAASPRTDALSPRSDGCLLIEVMIGAATVRIPPGTDATTLQTVLRAVKATT